MTGQPQTVSAVRQPGSMAHILVDCDRCEAHPRACAGCVVSVLLGTNQSPDQLELASDERGALAVMADAGLLPPLRLVLPAEPSGQQENRIAM